MESTWPIAVRRRAPATIAATLLVACAATSARADIFVIDFESLTLNDSSGHSIGGSYSEDGFTIDAVGSLGGSSLGFFGTGHFAHPGSTALALTAPDSMAVLTADDGSTFDLLSIDLTEFTSASQNVPVQFEGTRADATTVTSPLFTLDGSFGFETFNLTGFTNLESVSWSQTAEFHQFDNIILSTGDGTQGRGGGDPPILPAPGAALLAALGFGSIGWVRRRAA